MELTETTTKVDKLALLLLYMSSWEEKTLDFSVRRAWKGIDYGILDRLQESGLISQSRTAKSLFLTEDGEKQARKLARLLEQMDL
jgi:DNA-binding PadR family transcriptional regulator